jgi:hypothetical protein
MFHSISFPPFPFPVDVYRVQFAPNHVNGPPIHIINEVGGVYIGVLV